jgi:hypothetical protein
MLSLKLYRNCFSSATGFLMRVMDSIHFYKCILFTNPFKNEESLATWIKEKIENNVYFDHYFILKVEKEIGLPLQDCELISIVNSPYYQTRRYLYIIVLLYWLVSIVLSTILRYIDFHSIIIETAILYTFFSIFVVAYKFSISPYLYLYLPNISVINSLAYIASAIFGVFYFEFIPKLNAGHPYKVPTSADLISVAIISLAIIVMNYCIVHVINMIFFNLIRCKLNNRR